MLNLRKLVNNYKVIMVDLDNTLFNYTIANKIAIEEVLKKFDISKEEYAKSRINIKKRDLDVNHHKKEFYFKNICEMKSLSIITALNMYDVYSDVFKENLLVDQTMLNMMKLAKAKNNKIIAITNYYVIPQLRKLKASGFIDYIDYLVTSEEFEVEKPNRKLLNYALELAGNPDKSDVVMIGDSVVDNLSSLGVDYYPYNCSKLLISISGKSGAGKSTLTSKIKDIWNASVIEGDGYHKYERSNEAWSRMTHYNPDANNLMQMSLDIQTIYHDIGKTNVPIYNHLSGKFDKPNELNSKDIDVSIIEGLHTLYPEVTGDYVKLKIFIESVHSDSQKITRDISDREKLHKNVVKSINDREYDYNKYIAIQKKYSNFLIEVFENDFKITLSDELSNESETGITTGLNDKLFDTIEELMIKIKNSRYI